MMLTDQMRDEWNTLLLGLQGPDIPNTQKALLKRLIQDPDGIRMSPIIKASGKPPTLLDHAARDLNRQHLKALAENLIHYFDSHPIGKKWPVRLNITHTESTDTYNLSVA